ncbi:MAG: alpha/beta hydrolase [Anaerolineae bacterium]
MAQHPWLDPNPFYFPGGSTGCLLIHGFTGAPTEMRPMGEYLAAQGLSVLGVRLAGHGTTPEDLARTRWENWAASVQEGWQRLSETCDRVFVGGLSLGGLLALHLAAHEPTTAGQILMAPGLIARDWRAHFLPIARFFIKWDEPSPEQQKADLKDPEAWNRIWCYDRRPVAAGYEVVKLQRVVRRLLPQITCPTLIFQGISDQSVVPRGARIIFDAIRSPQKELVWLHNSGHCLTVDSEREAVWEKCLQFIRKISEA